jgi:hypothetical protein
MWEPTRATLLVVAVVACGSPKPRTPRFNHYCPAATPPRCSAAPAFDAREIARWGPLHVEQTVSVRGTLRLASVECPPRREEFGCSSEQANVYMGWLLLDFSFFCKCSLDEASLRLNEWPHGLCPMRPPDQTVIVTGKLKYREAGPDHSATYWLEHATMCVVG